MKKVLLFSSLLSANALSASIVDARFSSIDSNFSSKIEGQTFRSKATGEGGSLGFSFPIVDPLSFSLRLGYGDSHGRDQLRVMDRYGRLVSELMLHEGDAYGIYLSSGLSYHSYLSRHNTISTYGAVIGLGSRFDTAHGFGLGFEVAYDTTIEPKDYEISGFKVKDFRFTTLDCSASVFFKF